MCLVKTLSFNSMAEWATYNCLIHVQLMEGEPNAKHEGNFKSYSSLKFLGMV